MSFFATFKAYKKTQTPIGFNYNFLLESELFQTNIIIAQFSVRAFAQNWMIPDNKLFIFDCHTYFGKTFDNRR